MVDVGPHDFKRLRRLWLERSVGQGWTPWQSRFLLRAATRPEKPYGPFMWAPTWYPL